MLPVLESDRLILRQPIQADAERIRELAGHPDIAYNTLALPHPYPLEAAIQFIQYIADAAEKNHEYTFGIYQRRDNLLVGMISLSPRGSEYKAEVGYWVGVPYWGMGYATEATKRIIQHGFEDCKLNRIYAYHFTRNAASRRVQEKAGMIFEGVLRQNHVKDGAFLDSGVCAILREDWQK